MEVKELIDGIQKDWAEFKKTHTEQLKAKADGKSVADFDAKLAAINASIDEKTDRLNALETAFKRSPVLGANGQPAERPEVAQHKQAFMQYVRKGIEAGLPELERKALQVADDTQGGYMVHADLSGRMVKRIFETSPIRQFASIQTISTDALEGPVDADEASAGWVGESGARPQTANPKIGMWRIPTHELYAQPAATQKLLDDAAWDAEGWLTNKMADKFTRLENTAFVSGNGVTQPKGFLSYTATADDPNANYFALKQIGFVKTGAAADFPGVPASGTDPAQADPLINLVFSLKSQYRDMPGTAFAMNRGTFARVRRLRDNLGNYLWQPGLGGQPSTLLGYAIAEFNDMPSIGANTFPIAFANWREAYQIVDRQGVRILRDPFSAKPFVLFYGVKRTGGDVVNFEAIKLLKCAA